MIAIKRRIGMAEMKKNNWKVSRRDGKVCVENTKTGFCDWPILYKLKVLYGCNI